MKTAVISLNSKQHEQVIRSSNQNAFLSMKQNNAAMIQNKNKNESNVHEIK